ncbi:MAG: thioredoxin-disulfide reductase [Candidatus Aminicenantes bacterium]|nr:thioredoxin-disulfide reductase [Candidatus Aminicenantes bacterium]
MRKPTYDVIIVGAGPAGLSAGIYTGRALLKTLILDMGVPGGQILLTDKIENYPGFPDSIEAFSLADRFKSQAEKFGCHIKQEELKAIKKKEEAWMVSTAKNKYSTQTVIIATGSSHRKLDVPGERQLTGKGVSYCATCDGAFFRDKQVAVVGGGSYALTEALFLTKFAKRVYVIHRREQFRAEKLLQSRARDNDKIEFVLNSLVKKINGDQKLQSVLVSHAKKNQDRELKVDGLFVSIGMVPNTGVLKSRVDLNEHGEIVVGKGMMTSEKGIYAAGDVTDACSNQVATAVGAGVEAGIAVGEYIEENR